MNVFHINSNYLTSLLHENLMEKLEQKGIKNTIYMPRKMEKEEEFLYESKYKVYSPVAFKNKDKYLFTLKQHKIMKTLKNTVDIEQYDICHAHTLFTDGNVAYELNKAYGIPYVVTVRGMTDIDGFFKKRLNLRHRGRSILKQASKIVFLSASNKKELFSKYLKEDSREYEKKSVILPNGIDDFWFEHENAPKLLPDKQKVCFIYVGKINRVKNLLNAIEGLKVLKKEYGIEPALTVVGKVEDETVFRRAKSVSDIKITFLPQTPREKLVYLYRKNDIFIMPSFSETFGLVYPEAMSQGLPVIYSKGQGFDEQFEEGTVGYAVKAADQKDIAKKINSILRNYENISENCLKGYKKFNWDQLSSKYLTIYREVKV